MIVIKGQEIDKKVIEWVESNNYSLDLSNKSNVEEESVLVK